MTHELWTRAILALGALVVVPLGLRLVNRRVHAAGPGVGTGDNRLNVAWRLISFGQLPAALLLAWAQLLSAGANTQGATLEEARENLQEAVSLVLDANRELSEKSLAGKQVTKEPFVLASP